MFNHAVVVKNQPHIYTGLSPGAIQTRLPAGRFKHFVLSKIA
jgi:hypothetical protein